MTQQQQNILNQKESVRIHCHNKSILLDLKILSNFAGFEVLSYELSICLSEAHFGNNVLHKDGFISIEEYNSL